MRKKTKTQPTTRPAVPSGLAEPAFVRESLGLEDPETEEQDEQEPSAGRACPPSSGELPSVGAAQHASGECRPCAWFYKPQSCANGKDCLHCHLCPEGELKNRKKKGPGAKVVSEEAGETTKEVAEVGQHEGPGSPMLPPPPGLPAPAQLSAVAAPSMGSAGHATRECKPCAWFWKANSCSNGKDCKHCHLCPDNEIKRRKKAKLDGIRGSRDSAEEVSSDDDQDSEYAGDQPGYEDSEASPTCFRQPSSADFVCGENEEGGIPSSGSTLHALGKCKPCAWHWKPGGCQNGKECCHCHICPAGELKGRRKAKETAMRAGVMLPMKESGPSAKQRNLHVLNIFPLL